MKVLVACEFSGIVRDAFSACGHDAWSCDLLDTERPGNHIKGDVLGILGDGWDLMVAHPPCAYLATTGNRWMKPEYRCRFPTREQDRKDAIAFFMLLAHAPIAKIAIENPVGIMSTIWRRPDQYVHPYFFGDKHSKKTGLWLKSLPKLVSTKVVRPDTYAYKGNTVRAGWRDPVWHVETMNLPAEERTRARSRTFQGIADAMAQQWGGD